MQDVIKQLFAVIPEYLLSFFKLIASPKQFPLEKLPDNENEIKIQLTEALKFLLISYTLMILIYSWKNNTENFYEDLGVKAVSSLIAILVFSFSIFLGWRVFGSKSKFSNYIIIYCYHAGVSIIPIGLFGLISDGYIKFMDKNLYDNLIMVKEGKIAFNPDWLKDITYQIGLGIYTSGFVVVIIWANICWGAYRLMNKSNKIKSFAVAFVTGLFSCIAFIIITLINNGLKK